MDSLFRNVLQTSGARKQNRFFGTAFTLDKISIDDESTAILMSHRTNTDIYQKTFAFFDFSMALIYSVATSMLQHYF
jgi:hypothetical protein